MTTSLVYRNIRIDTDLDHGLAKKIIDELLKRRYFIALDREPRKAAGHAPTFMHIAYKGCKTSVLISRDGDKNWCCSLYSIKAFSQKQPPVFTVE